ncbi:ANTAR domain-containing protein [Nocardiopsis gilva]|uniref:ANTAR domain-containing protein n=1 Tax=Nocardiopsis gilva TaxID=280236 RepID=UPI0004759104|nr:ANTAR domain-containing protein [Nocardiopsis gilva]
MTTNRLSQLWALVAERAWPRGASVSLEDICGVCAAEIPSDGVSLTANTSPQDLVERLCATTPLAREIEELQATLGQGPGVAALSCDGPVLTPDLHDATPRRRWPAFAPAAVQAGLGAVFVFPLRTGAVQVGALSLHRAGPKPLTDAQLSDALSLADMALEIMLDGGADTCVEDRPLWNGFAAFHDQAEVHQAAGMISAQLDVGIDEALVRLRAYAFGHERPLADVARDVVRRRLKFTPDPQTD